MSTEDTPTPHTGNTAVRGGDPPGRDRRPPGGTRRGTPAYHGPRAAGTLVTVITGGTLGDTGLRDARILDALDPGEVVTLPELRDIVTSETDITADDTARERIKRVTDTEAFENIGRRHRPRWRYLGDTTDTDS